MNNHSNFDEGQRGPSLLIGLALGALVGAGAALLLAPAKGDETRRRLGETAKRWSNDARRQIDRGRGAITNLKDDAKNAIDAGRDAMQHRRDSRGTRPEPQTAQRSHSEVGFGGV